MLVQMVHVNTPGPGEFMILDAQAADGCMPRSRNLEDRRRQALVEECCDKDDAADPEREHDSALHTFKNLRLFGGLSLNTWEARPIYMFLSRDLKFMSKREICGECKFFYLILLFLLTKSNRIGRSSVTSSVYIRLTAYTVGRKL